MRKEPLYAPTSLQADPFGTTQINQPAPGKEARELSETFKLLYLEIANPFGEGATPSRGGRRTMKVVKLERPLETDTWPLNESGRGLAWPPAPWPVHTSLPQILEGGEPGEGGQNPREPATNGLLKAINSF